MITAVEPIFREAESIPQPQVDNSRSNIRQRILSTSSRRWVDKAPVHFESNEKPIGTATADQEDPRKVINLPKFEPVMGRPSECFAALQEWEGVVTRISDTAFNAHLYDVTNNSKTVEEFAEFLIEDLDDAQRASLRPGAIFRWAIGITKKDSGRQTKSSVIYFRKLAKRPTEFFMPIFATSTDAARQ